MHWLVAQSGCESSNICMRIGNYLSAKHPLRFDISPILVSSSCDRMSLFLAKCELGYMKISALSATINY
jgi:hypothetical protein